MATAAEMTTMTSWSSRRCVIFVAAAGGAVALSAYAAYRYYCRKSQNENDTVCSEDINDTIDEGDAEELDQRVLVLGLSGAGKTSLLASLSKQDVTRAPQPTDGFNIISINSDNITLNVWEVGGADNVRAHWANFTYGTNILVFVVDSSDKDKFTLAGNALQTILKEENLKNVPVIVVANKQDLPTAESAEDVLAALQPSPSVKSQHKFNVVATQVPLNGPAVGVSKLRDMFHT